MTFSYNTKAILLLTAPLIAGGVDPQADVLTRREYRQLAKLLAQLGLQPVDLLTNQADGFSCELKAAVDPDRLKRLLDRDFQLSQAAEHWQSTSLWVVSHLDNDYPQRMKERLSEQTPSVIYGCGDATILNSGGLAVVGSRDVDSSLIEYAEAVGRLAALAKRPVISGGARGIDQAAMRGALTAGGKSVGVLTDSLERSALNRENQKLLIDGNLVLISPYDPAAAFNIGHAMQRNKVIYSVADAALVVNSDYEKGGTWAGAIEQLDKLHLIPLYVRSDGNSSLGLDALLQKGAIPWPNPSTADDLLDLLQHSSNANKSSHIEQLSLLEI